MTISVCKPKIGIQDLLLLIPSMLFLILTVGIIYREDLVDFLAFIGAARKVLLLQSPYGAYPTPLGASVFQSLPWVSWLFIPFALMSEDYTWAIFVIVNLVILLIVVMLIKSIFQYELTPSKFIFLYSCATAISFFCLNFGQVTIIQLGFLALLIYLLSKRKSFLAGFLVPFILLKPQLLIWFMAGLYARQNRKFIGASIISFLLVSILALVINRSWPMELINTIVVGRAESTMENWKYSTLSGMLFLQPHYGYLLIPIALPFYLWLYKKIKDLQLPIQLVMLLPFSLAASPYAFAYDLPLLIPFLLIWSKELSPRKVVFWILISMISILNLFSSLAYLVVLFTCVLLIKMISSPEEWESLNQAVR